MSVLDDIRKAIKQIPIGKVFSSRRFLSLGTRGSVDQAIYLLVKANEIVRVARGVFVKAGSANPSAWHIAKCKAESFGKKIFTHGADAAEDFGLQERSYRNLSFACLGRTSSFKIFGRYKIILQGVSPRKLHAYGSVIGDVIRALWHLGKNKVNDNTIDKIYWRFCHQIDELKEAAPMLPDWMNQLFYWGRR